MDTPIDLLRVRRRRLTAALLLAAALAAGIGIAAGWIAWAGIEADPDDPWAELGRAIVAGLVAVVLGVIALVAGTVLAVRRTVEPGRQLATGATALATVASGALVLGWLGETTARAGAGLLAVPAGMLLFAAAGAMVGRAARLVPRQVTMRLVTSAAAVLGTLGLVADVRADTVNEQRRAARYEATEAPLALVGGTDLDVDLVGWRLESVDDGWGHDRVTVTYAVAAADGTGSAWVRLMFDADPDAVSCARARCDDLGRLDSGRPVRGLRSPAAPGSYASVWVDVPGGRWELDTSWDGVLGPEAAAVLRSLEPVDADRFAAAT